MKRLFLLTLAGLLLAATLSAAAAVKPAYVGPYGNPEEPALRPYKWMWRGVKALFYQTGTHFRDGNLHTPVVGSTHALRGLRKGTFEILESTYKGMLYAPVPPRGDFKQLRAANTHIDQSNGLYHLVDFGFSWFLYPVIRVVDEYPVNDDTEVQLMIERHKEIREARRAGRAQLTGVDAVEAAQRRYIGDRANYSEQWEQYR
jgi:hypothetical protein